MERQYDPADDAFIPRAFSITHVNLTHRNWTAIGVPDRDALPIVDPRGLVTPFWDGWSLDGWIVARDGQAECDLTGREAKPEWRRSIERGARRIQRNRLTVDADGLDAGLLPPGFSAEHLGPNDYYFWDDFWGIAGLRAASLLLPAAGGATAPSAFREEAERFREAVEKSLSRVALRLGRPGMPASPHRRLDSGAVGSLAAGYPLQIFPPRDEVLDTVEFLLSRCLVNGGFYQDIIHSGVNPYLTLHVAQVLLRAGDARFGDLVRTVAGLASPTGQWPEAVHPRTGGGCMGDGHHAWASAEWVLMIRNMFVREEEGRLVLASGILPEWLETEEPISFGPAPTSFGDARVEIQARGRRVEVLEYVLDRLDPSRIVRALLERIVCNSPGTGRGDPVGKGGIAFPSQWRNSNFRFSPVFPPRGMRTIVQKPGSVDHLLRGRGVKTPGRSFPGKPTGRSP